MGGPSAGTGQLFSDRPERPEAGPATRLDSGTKRLLGSIPVFCGAHLRGRTFSANLIARQRHFQNYSISHQHRSVIADERIGGRHSPLCPRGHESLTTSCEFRGSATQAATEAYLKTGGRSDAEDAEKKEKARLCHSCPGSRELAGLRVGRALSPLLLVRLTPRALASTLPRIGAMLPSERWCAGELGSKAF